MTVTQTADGIVIDVRVTPRSSRSGVAARLFGVPCRAVMIMTGHRNRLKRVRVHGVSASSVRAKLDLDADGGGAAATPDA